VTSNERTAERARAHALHAAVSTVAAPGLGAPRGLFVLSDGTRLACAGNSIRVLAPCGLLYFLTAAGSNTSRGNQDGPGADARFDTPTGITVDPAGNVVLVDYRNHALCLVSKASAVSTLAGGGAGFADGQGAAACFNLPNSVVVTANGDNVMTDFGNHAVRVVTPDGAVRTMAGNGEPGFVEGLCAAARLNRPTGLALDVDGNILVTDRDNHAVRRVRMAGAVRRWRATGRKGIQTLRALPRASIAPRPWWWTRRARS
jgi:hypothetical protein